MKSKIQQGKRRRGTGIIAAGFLLVILAGAVLLMLPVSSADRSFTNPLDAVFTAVSATCVTGLVTLDTAHWSLFGQIVILIMIQTGGLGFMTVAVSPQCWSGGRSRPGAYAPGCPSVSAGMKSSAIYLTEYGGHIPTEL